MPFYYTMMQKDAKAYLVVGLITALMLSIVRWIMQMLPVAGLQVTTDIQGLINAITSQNILAALLVLVGIFILGVIVMYAPRLAEEIL